MVVTIIGKFVMNLVIFLRFLGCSDLKTVYYLDQENSNGLFFSLPRAFLTGKCLWNLCRQNICPTSLSLLNNAWDTWEHESHMLVLARFLWWVLGGGWNMTWLTNLLGWRFFVGVIMIWLQHFGNMVSNFERNVWYNLSGICFHQIQDHIILEGFPNRSVFLSIAGFDR